MTGTGPALRRASATERALPLPPGPQLMADPDAERLLSERGWVVVPYLDADEVAAVRAGYALLHPEGGRGFDTDFAYLDTEHKWAVEELIRPAIAPRLDGTFVDAQVFNATFVMKWPGADGVLPVHQDWSYVDERTARSVSLWVALDDISPERGNGPLGFVSGSHRLPCEPRGATSFGWYRPWSERIAEALEPVSVRAGEAVVFDNRILHASTDNTSDLPRLAIASMVARADEPLGYVHREPDDWVVHEADRAFFVEHSPVDLRLGSPPGVPVRERRRVEPFAAPVADLEALCGAPAGSFGPAPTEPEAPLSGSPLRDPRPGLAQKLRLRPTGPPLWTEPASQRGSDLAALAAAAWSTSDPASGVAVGDVIDHWGPFDLIDLDLADPRGTEQAALVAALRSLGAEEAALATIGVGFQMAPRQEDRSSHLALLVPIELPRPLGSVMFQAADRMVTLRPGTAVVLDPSAEHMAWNRGARPVVALLANVPRRRFRPPR